MNWKSFNLKLLLELVHYLENTWWKYCNKTIDFVFSLCVLDMFKKANQIGKQDDSNVEFTHWQNGNLSLSCPVLMWSLWYL